MSAPGTTEPFPPMTPGVENPPSSHAPDESQVGRSRTLSNASSIGRRSLEISRRRTSSFAQAFLDSNPPLGMWQATAEVSSKIPTLPEIRNGAFAADGWSHEGQMERRGTNPHEIHRKRLARTSSATTRTRRTSASIRTPLTPGGLQEENEYFPAVDNQEGATGTTRIPTTIEESQTIGKAPADTKSAPNPADITEAAEPVDSSYSSDDKPYVVGPDETGTYPNGYRFPKKHTWGQSTVIGLKAFWRFFLTPFGFIITIYGLNVVAWGAMIFFVLLNAAPALCHPSCNDINSGRKKWIEWDSQILNALFCVTGFGLIPWRFRDFYFLMRWRLMGDQKAFRRLAGINRSWFRLPGSDHLADDIGPPPVYTKKNPRKEGDPPPYSEEEIAEMEGNPAIPLPVTAMPSPPLTGVRAKPTKPHSIDIVVWMYLWNTIMQGGLAGVMWGLNRYNRPGATTGIFITVASLVAIVAGVVVFIEGKKVKAAEGIPVQEYDVFEDIEVTAAKVQEKDAKKHKHDKQANHDAEKPATGEDGSRPTLVRTHTGTEKVKGEHWFERN